nr:hypothetical protein Iba_chr06cCG7260 [Ipomoea batatas]
MCTERRKSRPHGPSMLRRRSKIRRCDRSGLKVRIPAVRKARREAKFVTLKIAFVLELQGRNARPGGIQKGNLIPVVEINLASVTSAILARLGSAR